MQDTRHNYWVTMWRDVFYRYNTVTGKLYTYSLPAISKQLAIGNTAEKIVNSIYEDNHGVIWIGTENAGLLKYDVEKDNFETIFIDGKNIPNNEYNYAIVTIFQDREENIWLGTDKGITIFNPYRQYFQSIHHEPGNKASLPKSEINAFIQAGNGDMLIGTWGGGITVYDSTWQYKKNILLNGPVDQNLVWSFIQNEDGKIWAGCQHGYIDIYDPQTQTVSSIHPPEVENITIYCMTKDAKGNIWLGLYNGKIAKWDKQENKFYAYGGSANENLSSVMHIFFDKQNQCWVSTTSGFKKFDTEKRIYTEVYLPDTKNPAAISGKTTEGIEQYDDSTLVIGSVNSGILFFNIKTKTFSRFSAAGKLPSNNVYAIKKDAKGNVWFTTDYSLYKFTLPNKTITHYNLAPGVIGSSFTTTNIEVLQDGRWMTATATNIICFDPAVLALPQNTTAPVQITGFSVFDNPFFIDSLLANKQPVQLTYKQHFFTVEFALLSFSQLRQTRYYYRLQSVNSDWVDAGTKQFASYTNLEPGTYIFEVKADNGNGMTPVTSFSVIIAAPFWKTTWFKLLVLVLAGLLVYLFVKWRIKNIRMLMANKIQAIEFEQSLQQAKMEMLGINEKLSEARLEALRSQMNPHFIFNCLNSIDNLIQNNEKEKATQYLAKFARLIRAVLETSKNNTVPCWKDMETLKVYIELEALRLDNKFSYRINTSDDILNGDYKVPPLVIQPFVENAIHHGLLNKISADRQLSIEVTALGNSIHYIITDNGVGRAKAAGYKQLNKPAHMSMGMQITSERIHLFNQQSSGSVKITDLYDENQQPCGTRVEVELLNQ